MQKEAKQEAVKQTAVKQETAKQAAAKQKEIKKKPLPARAANAKVVSTGIEKPVKENEVTIAAGDREAKAKEIIKKNIYWSAGMELLPFPLLDLAALAVIQVKMVRDISRVYGVPFRENDVRAFILSLISGFNVCSFSWIAWCSFIKFFPGIGNLMGLAASSALAGAATYAVGKVFIQHFEMGGTLLNFNPVEMREYFREQYQQGIEQAKESKKNT